MSGGSGVERQTTNPEVVDFNPVLCGSLFLTFLPKPKLVLGLVLPRKQSMSMINISCNNLLCNQCKINTFKLNKIKQNKKRNKPERKGYYILL